MREQGLGDSEVEPPVEKLEFEALACEQVRAGHFVPQTGGGEFDVVARIEQRLMGVDAEIVPRREILGIAHASPQAPGADIEEVGVRQQPLRKEELELEGAESIPIPANEIPVPAFGDHIGNAGLILVGTIHAAIPRLCTYRDAGGAHFGRSTSKAQLLGVR
jgi:hypothetical protein